MRKLLLLPIRAYRYSISPLMASHCRHYPSCSAYAMEAIQTHGSLKGLYLSVTRLLRCHPWAKGGYDPVPGSASIKPDNHTCHRHDLSASTSQTATNQTTH